MSPAALKKTITFLARLVIHHKDTMETTGRFTQVKAFLHMLASDELSSKQVKSLLGKLSRAQRLAIVEIVTNIVYCNLEPTSSQEVEKLLKHESRLRKIALGGRSLDNDMLKRNHSAVVCALRVGLDVLGKGLPAKKKALLSREVKSQEKRTEKSTEEPLEEKRQDGEDVKGGENVKLLANEDEEHQRSTNEVQELVSPEKQ